MSVWLTHVVTGVALAGVILAHLLAHRAGVARRFRLPRRAPRRAPGMRAGYALFLALAVAMTASGVARWVGVPPQRALHATTSYGLLLAAVVHLWVVRRALRARLRRSRRHQERRA